VIVADVFNWSPQYLYYARRRVRLLAHGHEKLFYSNWKYRKLLAVCDKS
jgi:hypothetical protein